jgi:hypothetical protein
VPISAWKLALFFALFGEALPRVDDPAGQGVYAPQLCTAVAGDPAGGLGIQCADFCVLHRLAFVSLGRIVTGNDPVRGFEVQ